MQNAYIGLVSFLIMKLQKSENDNVGNKNPLPTLAQNTSMALSQQWMDYRTVQIAIV